MKSALEILSKPPPAARAHLTPLLGRRQKVKYALAIALWLALIAHFWAWWLQPAHNIDPLRYWLVTAVLGWITLLQLYFLAIFPRASIAADPVAALGRPRVAMIVTKTPSEPFAVVRRTLEAMLAQDYPHDTWLADEDPAPETLNWCAAHGVKVTTRKGRDDYHRAEWPRRTRCKEGNLAFFYDTVGYRDYDFVAQFDADHTPRPGYLRAILRPFADSAVGYVSAPSICARNAGQSWAARTRLYSEAMFHGALQAGYSRGWAPMCIGSHYAVRTRALKQVGGLGPELAEDHSTSMIMNAGGWRGVHAIDAIAIGDGPATLADMLTQEFQWSRSLVSLLLRYTPRYFGGLSPLLKFQFLFSQLWYPLFAVFMLVAFALPVWAVMADVRFADVTYPGFLAHSVPPMLVLVWIAFQVRADGLFRPADASVISWERALFVCAQWPWVLWGCAMAVRDRLAGGFVDFRITPKGDAAARAELPFPVIAPYIVLALAAGLPVLLVDGVENAAGFYLLSLVNAALYTALVAAAVIHHLRENDISILAHPARRLLQGATVAGLVALVLAAGGARGMQGLHYLSAGLGPFQFVEARFVVSGAGAGEPGTLQYVFDFSAIADRLDKIGDQIRRP
ncbi:cellulose synthase (UDP-forming) [Rhodovulum iodosum]|uniref:Cellulose synthase (UDP-forming) n=1 Tax=Rhodovulum iodosum TaxID=68291 RepID=A0ABV3XTV4_9RHOB|nr:glycosyltransferase family 2 protein [Rhodovulum robiginosum]RSK32199.1 glycosyltransferase [Rhodovulum robiginosum]